MWHPSSFRNSFSFYFAHFHFISFFFSNWHSYLCHWHSVLYKICTIWVSLCWESPRSPAASYSLSCRNSLEYYCSLAGNSPTVGLIKEYLIFILLYQLQHIKFCYISIIALLSSITLAFLSLYFLSWTFYCFSISPFSIPVHPALRVVALLEPIPLVLGQRRGHTRHESSLYHRATSVLDVQCRLDKREFNTTKGWTEEARQDREKQQRRWWWSPTGAVQK